MQTQAARVTASSTVAVGDHSPSNRSALNSAPADRAARPAFGNPSAELETHSAQQVGKIRKPSPRGRVTPSPRDMVVTRLFTGFAPGFHRMGSPGLAEPGDPSGSELRVAGQSWRTGWPRPTGPGPAGRPAALDLGWLLAAAAAGAPWSRRCRHGSGWFAGDLGDRLLPFTTSWPLMMVSSS